MIATLTAPTIVPATRLSRSWLVQPADYLHEQEYQSDKPYRYFTNCVNISRHRERYLHEMIDNAIDISRRTFIRHCGWQEISDMLGYPRHPRQGLTMAGDYHISYHRSKYRGVRCYYLRHSAIEYIFVPSNFQCK